MHGSVTILIKQNITHIFVKGDPYPTNLTVRRANSCPEMKKSHVVPAIDNISKPLDETDEEIQSEVVANGLDITDKKELEKQNKYICPHHKPKPKISL